MIKTRRSAIVPNQKGLHARAAAQIVSLSNQYSCEITVAHGDKSAPSLSLIKLLTLDAPQGSKLTVTSEGAESALAVSSIIQLILSGFGE